MLRTLRAIGSCFRPQRKCYLLILCMVMESWTLSFYLGNAEIESQNIST